MSPRLVGLAGMIALTLGCSAPGPDGLPRDPGPAAEPAPEVTRAPSALTAAALPAEPLPDLGLTLADGSATSLRALLGDGRALVIAFSSLRCPVSRLYAPSWEPLRAAWAEQGVNLVFVNPMRGDGDAEVLANAEELGWAAPVARDPEGALTELLDARRTADVFLVDPGLRVVYRGARDDQYGIGYRLATPRKRYLDDALAALLAGGEIETAATEAPG